MSSLADRSKEETRETDFVSFEDVLAAELDCVGDSRGWGKKDPRRDGEAYERAQQMKLLGVAFSGGGIRSATFNLGVLQSLARYGLLERADYLSTVSGGGYIGGWLAAWIRQAGGGVAEVARKLRESLGEDSSGFHGPDQTLPPEPAQIGYLRRYSNYLTPKTGLASGDTWAAVGIYLRNLLLNQLVLWLLLAGGIWALRAVHDAVHLSGIFGLLVTAVAWGYAARTVRLHAKPKKEADFGSFSGLVTAVFLLAASTFLAPTLAKVPADWWRPTALAFTAAGLGLLLIHRADLAVNDKKTPALTWAIGIVTGTAVAGALITLVPGLLRPLSPSFEADWMQALADLVVVLEPKQALTVWGGPLLLLAFSVGGAMYMGVMSRGLPAMRREWWGRFGGIAVAVSAAWSLLMLIALGGPIWISEAGSGAYTPLAAALWAAVTGTGLYLGRSPATSGVDKPSPLSKVATVAPYIFIVGLLIAISGITSGVFEMIAGQEQGPTRLGMALNAVLGALALALGALLTWRIDVNVFSLHGFYRNRLARCYQGGANPGERVPDAFTGFAEADDEIRLADLRPEHVQETHRGPYPLINATLNLVGGKNLAWQKRKGASFLLSPRYCGYGAANRRPPTPGNDDDGVTLNAYRRSEQYAGGLKLSAATAISGAAASPNMGYHSSAPLAFLMTVFNVRLGWWAANPNRDAWRDEGPTLSLAPLLAELFGLSNEERDFVYLSDGGHFENLGVYELVRRRCRFIIACDAEADSAFQFDGLGNAIEKCRTDFGVEIDLDTASIQKARETEPGCRHCAVGTIDYGDGFSGTLLYLKLSVTGDEPADVERYRAQNPGFPHQSTADQWFDETQFESYRRLGLHVMESTLAAAVERRKVASLTEEEIFAQLRRHWHAPSRRGAGAFTRHSQRFAELMEDMAADLNLGFLDKQFNPSWHIASGDGAVRKETMELPAGRLEQRAGYYFCRRLIQLMEDVFIDLGLDEEYEHPDNHGWMNLFRNWSYAGIFRLTWAVTASTYGARFQDFCERRLELATGRADAQSDPVYHGFQEGVSPELPDELNFLEKEIAAKVIQLYFASAENDQSPELRVVRVAINARFHGSDKVLLPVGFALVTPGGGELIYLRIQDHLWSMGLGRQAICSSGVQALYEPTTAISTQATSSDAPGLPTPEDVARFRRLFSEAMGSSPNDAARGASA